MAEAKAQLSALCETGLQRRQPAGLEHCGDNKVLTVLPWGRGLRQGKQGKSLTTYFVLFMRKPYGLALSEAVARL